MGIGYDTFHQTFLTAEVPDRAPNNINTTLKVVEGTAHYYIISVGKLAAEEDKRERRTTHSTNLKPSNLISAPRAYGMSTIREL